MRKRVYFKRGKGAVGFCACLKIDECTLFKQAIVVWKFGVLKCFD